MTNVNDMSNSLFATERENDAAGKKTRLHCHVGIAQR